MTRAMFAVLILVTGCGLEDSPYNALERYECTEYQMQKATAETQFCKKETEFTASYCYGAAILRNCARKSDKSPPMIFPAT